MNYIVLDLEWNQAPDLKAKLKNELTFEIIEIGAVRLDENKNQTGAFHELIKPQVFNKMNHITGELIHISMDELSDCRSFEEVMRDFIGFCGDDYIFCTWGNIDILELQRNMDYYKMTPLSEAPIKYYDVQKLFSLAYDDGKQRRTLEYAVDFLGIKKDTAFHRADSDAYYTALALQHIENKEVFKNYSFDTYRLPKTKEDEIHICFQDYSKYISRPFADKTEAMQDREVLSTYCFICGGRTRRKIPWFSANGRHYYTIVSCSKHGMLKGKIRMKKVSDKNLNSNEVFVIKTLKLADDEAIQEVMLKKEHSKKLRNGKKHKKYDI